jgi:hypothetical protein
MASTGLRRRVTTGTAVLPLLAVFVLAMVASIPVGRAYVARHRFTAENNAALAFRAPAGDRVLIGVRLHNSINGLWASTGGLTLTLTGRDPVTVRGPAEQSWGEAITTKHDTDPENFAIAGAFTIPDLGARGGTLDGQLTGDVVYPTSGGFGFRNETASISVPVEVTVLPRSEAPLLAGRRAVGVTLWTATVVMAVLFVIAILSLFRALRFVRDHRFRDVFWWVAGLLLFGALLLLVTGAVTRLAQPSIDDATLGLPVPILVVPILTGGTFTLATLAWFLRP